MKIDVDVRTLSTRNGGISYYTYGLWKTFASACPQVAVRFFTHGKLLPAFPLAGVDRIAIPQRWGGSVLWQEWAFPRQTRHSGAIPFGADFSLSGRHQRRGAFMVYDLMFLNSADTAYRDAMVAGVERSIRAGHMVITISDYCRKQIIDYFSLPAEQVRVVYCGVEKVDEESCHSSEEGRRTGLFISELSHRKNVVALLEAIAGLYRRGEDFEFHFIGKQTADHADIERVVNALSLRDERRIHWHGWISEEEKDRLWKQADLLVLPSKDEGFGMPVVEAMAQGVPVVASDGGAIPEVAGGAALLTPLDADNFAESLAANISRGFHDAQLRQELIRKGYQNARRFLWQESAKELYLLMEELDG